MSRRAQKAGLRAEALGAKREDRRSIILTRSAGDFDSSKEACMMASSLEDPLLLRHFKGHKDAVTSVAFSHTNQVLATSSMDKYIIIWNLKPNCKAFRFVGHTEGVTCVDFSPDGCLMASSSQDWTARLWIPCIHGESTPLKGHNATVSCVNFSYDSQFLATASNDKTVKVWSVQNQRHLITLSQHTHWVRCVKYSPDGRLIASCSEDKTVKLWDLRNKTCVNSIVDYEGYPNYVEFNPDGTCIARASSDCTVKLWDIRMNKLLQCYRVHSDGVNCVAFHPSGSYLITAANDETLKIVDLSEGRLLYTLRGHEGPVLSVAFSKGGETFASGGLDAQVLLWKTNFDIAECKKVLEKNTRRMQTEQPPHLLDIYPRSPHQHNSKPQSVEINPNCDLLNMQASDPAIIDISASPSISKAKTNAFLATKTGITVEYPKDSQNCPAISTPTRPKRNLEEENKGTTRTMDKQEGIPMVLTSALENIVEQLDVITLTISIMEQRLTLTEDKLKECLESHKKTEPSVNQ